MAQPVTCSFEAEDFPIGTFVLRRFTRNNETLEVACEVVDPYSEEFSQLLKGASLFRKTVEVRIQATQPGDIVYTEQSSTQRTAQAGDVLVYNPTGETYLISASDLAARYEPKADQPGIYFAKGIVRACSLPRHVLLKASWGEWLGAMAGDMIAEREDTGERYCIERPAFDGTFAPLNI